MDLAQLCSEAEDAGMAGLLIRDHCTSTVGRVAVLNQMGRGICRFFCALALNPPVGGLNPTAVEASLRAGIEETITLLDLTRFNHPNGRKITTMRPCGYR
jgi:hypothetical protein